MSYFFCYSKGRIKREWRIIMRLSNEELKQRYVSNWNDERHDIGRVMYGDDPLIVYDEKDSAETVQSSSVWYPEL